MEFALDEGKSLRDCGRFANAVASLSVEHMGATAGVKDRETADRRFAEYLEKERRNEL